MTRQSVRVTVALVAAALTFAAGGLVAQGVAADPCDALYSGTVESEHAYAKCRLDRIEYNVSPTSAPTPSPTATSTPTQPAGWRADLAGVPVGTMGCNTSSTSSAVVELKKQWDYWDNCGGSVVDPGTIGIQNPPGGKQRVVRWQKTTSSDQVYQKLNRTFTKDNWPRGGSGKTGSPSDVSGRYVTYRYVPSSDLVLNPRHGWLVLMSFKENYLDANNAFHQDGTGWKLGCNNFTPGFTGTVRCAMTPKKSFNLADYTNRWVKWEYRVYQGAKDTTGHGGRIELWADDRLIDTGYEGESGGHVGSAAFVPLNRTQAWVFTVGQYTSNQTTSGVADWRGTHMTSYVGPTSVTPIG